MFRIIALLIGYAIGCIQTAYFVGKIYGIDIREHGSKNAGMTNVTRTVGKKAGAFVFIVDIFKSVAAFAIASIIFEGGGTFFPAGEFGALPGIYAGIGAVLGHSFPAFLKFRGGKGVSCIIGLIIMLDWRIALIVFLVGIGPFAITRYISLGSLIVTFVAPTAMLFLGYKTEEIAVMTAISSVIWFMHRSNIKRLLTGKESRIFSKK